MTGIAIALIAIISGFVCFMAGRGYEFMKKGSLYSKIQMVRDFQYAFKRPPSTQVTHLSDKEYELMFNLMKEELEEYLQANKYRNMDEIADSLGDMLYVLLFIVNKHGLDLHFNEIFDEIHKSNMSKLDDNGEPIIREDGKILKGPNYFKPNIRQILES